MVRMARRPLPPVPVTTPPPTVVRVTVVRATVLRARAMRPTVARAGSGYGRRSWACPTGGPCGACVESRDRGGPSRSGSTRPTEVAQAFAVEDVAVVVDGGRREGPLPTVVDATVTPMKVLREGALPASFIEGTMLMSTRRRLFSRSKRPDAG